MVSEKNNQVMNNRVVLNLIQTEEFLDNHKLSEYTAMLRRKHYLNNKILLVQSPQFLLETLNVEIVRNKGCYAFPPTGLQCIAKSISDRNLELSLFDLNYLLLKKIINDGTFDYNRWLDILDEYLKKFNPSIIGVTSLTANGDVLRPIHPLTSLLSHLRKKDRHIVIAGGPTPTSEYEDYLKKDLCHFVVAKEGENKINFLLDSIYNEMPTVSPTNGIYFNYAGAIEQTKGKVGSLALKGNLIGTYQYVPIEDYKNVGSLNPYSRMAGQDKIFSVFQLNRGCKADCKFCDVSKFMGRGTRNYPADDLISEILYLVERRGVRHLEVLDDDFIGDGHVVVDFLKKLVPIKEKYGITWAANNGLIAASITEELMDIIYLSGCIGFKIGIESGNAEMLIKIRKPATLPLLRKKRSILTKYPNMFIGGC